MYTYLGVVGETLRFFALLGKAQEKHWSLGSPLGELRI